MDPTEFFNYMISVKPQPLTPLQRVLPYTAVQQMIGNGLCCSKKATITPVFKVKRGMIEQAIHEGSVQKSKNKIHVVPEKESWENRENRRLERNKEKQKPYNTPLQTIPEINFRVSKK